MKKKYFSYILIYLFFGFSMIVRSQDHTIDKVADLIDKVIKWQNQQTDHVEKYTRTNWQFASYYIGVMKAFKATGNKDYQNFCIRWVKTTIGKPYPICIMLIK